MAPTIQTTYLSTGGRVSRKNVLDFSGFGEKFSHGPRHSSDIGLGLFQGIKLVGKVFSKLDLQVKTAQRSVIAETKNKF